MTQPSFVKNQLNNSLMSLNDQISSLRSLASEVKKQSGSSVRQHAANGLLDILRLRKQFVDLIYQAEAEKETTAKARGCLEAVSSIDQLSACMDCILSRSDPSISLKGRLRTAEPSL